MQAHGRVCEENKLELEEKDDTYWNNFAIKGSSLIYFEGSYRKSG